MNPSTAAFEPDRTVDAWLTAALADPSGHAYGEARSALFTAVREDHAGTVARMLFSRTGHPLGAARGRILALLTDMSWGASPWHEAADCALLRLNDPDPAVRRSAAWLLGTAAPDRAQALIVDPNRPVDPVARLARAEALFSSFGERTDAASLSLAMDLRTDPDDAVRLRAALAAIRVAPRTEWPMWEKLALSCLPVAGERLGGAGSRLAGRPGWWWSLALIRNDREDAAYTWASRLLTHPSTVARRAGVDMARGALRHWRGAADRLSGPLRDAALDDPDAAVRAEAVRSICASLEATRICADALAAVLEDSDLRSEAAMGLGRVGDQRAAAPLSVLVRTGFHARGLGEAVDTVVRGCADPAVWVTAAREALRAAADEHCREGTRGRWCPLAGALTAALALGPAAAPLVPELVALVDVPVRQAHDCPAWARRRAVDVLAAVGPSASSAAPALLRCMGQDGLADACAVALVAVTGDRTHAERRLDQLPDTVRAARRAVELMECLHRHGGLAPRHAERLQQMTQHPSRLHPRALRLLWDANGPAVAGLLLDALPAYLTDDLFGREACRLLADMGSLAQPAVPALEAVAHPRTRIAVHTGDEDEELRIDEHLAHAARTALERLSSTPCEKDGSGG